MQLNSENAALVKENETLKKALAEKSAETK
jgi:hypothetical protein